MINGTKEISSFMYEYIEPLRFFFCGSKNDIYHNVSNKNIFIAFFINFFNN